MKKALLTLLWLLFLVVQAQAATYWASPTLGSAGNCTNAVGTSPPSFYLRTIAAGIACLASGDTLYIRAGTYTVNINTDVTFIPSGIDANNPTIIAGYSGETATLAPSGTSEVINVGVGQNATLRDLKFMNLDLNCLGANDGGQCVGSNGATTRITFDGVTVRDGNDNNAFSTGALTTYWLIRNCIIQDIGGGYGIYNTGSYLTFENNIVRRVAAYGVHNYHFGFNDASNNTYRYNTFTNNGAAIQFSAAILLDSGSNNAAYGNLIYGNQRGGIHVNNCTNCSVLNNTIYGNSIGFANYNGLLLGDQGTPVNLTVRNNIIAAHTNGGGNIGVAGATTPTHDHNLCDVAGTWCDTTQATSAIFVTPGTDFHLKAGSAAINAGTNLGSAYSPDLAGVARPTSGAWEIGAYESGTAGNTWYAGTGGSDSNNCTAAQTLATRKLTIAAGLACMTSAGGGGHTLYITAGTYTEAALVPPSGTSIAHNTIASYGSDTVTFTGFSGNIHAFNFYSGNFHWLDFVGGCTTGINRTCRMTFDGTAGGSDYNKSGIVFSTNDNSAPSAGDLIFDGVRVTKFPGLGFSGGANITVRNSRIDYNGTVLAPPFSPLGQAGYAFYIHGRYVIENNEIDHSGGFGIHLFGTEGTNNYIFRYNYIHDNGITPSDNNPSGIILATPGTSGHEVYGNIVWGGINGVGIEVRNCTGCLIYNNTVYNNQNGGIATGILGGPTNTQVKNNIVSGNGGSQISNDTGIGTTWATNLCSAAGVGCDATLGTEAASATFNNPGVDFTLKAGSKAINAGANLGSTFSPDIAGVARPSIGPWEIGAYEFTGSTGTTYWVSASLGSAGNCSNAVGASPPSFYLRTIAAGIACLASGDTLNIRGGTYNERIESLPTSLSGSSYATATTIQGYANEMPVLGRTDTGTSAACIQMATPVTGTTYQYFIFKNFKCDGGSGTRSSLGTQAGGGFNGGSVHHIKFDGLEVTRYVSPMFIGGDDGVGTDIWITNGYVHDNGDGGFGGHCFYVETARVLIENTRCINQSGFGVQVYNQSGIDATGAVIRNNYWENTGIGDGRGSTAIAVLNGSNAQVYNNVIINNQAGIGVAGVDGAQVYNNTLYGNGVGHGEPGCCYGTVKVENTTNATIKNNLIINNVNNFIEVLGGSSGLTQSNNLTSGVASDIFTNPAGKDFTLKASATGAINTGANLGPSFSPDYAGVARPTSGAWEIGAYEVGSSCPAVTPALVASYGFEGNTTDSSGNGRTAALGAGWSYVGGKYGQGVVSTGVSGITVADHDSLDPCGGYTYEGWINLPNTSGNYVFIVKDPDSHAYVFGSIVGYCGGSAGVPIGGYSESPGGALACYPTPIGSGFQHLAVTYDSTLGSANVKLYLNGTVVATANGNALLTPTTGPLQFCNSSFNEICPSGTIVDNIMVYNYPRSGPQITADMNAPVGILAAPALKLSGGSIKFGASANAMKVR